MSIADLTYRIKYDGDGADDTFTFAFKVFAEADLEVILIDSSGVETVQVLDTDFTVVLNAGEGGTVTMTTAPAIGEELVILNDLAQTQPDSLDGGPLPEETIERMLDKSMLLIQQLQGVVARIPKLKATTAYPNPTIPEPVQGRGLVWSSGNLVHTSFDLSALVPSTTTGVAESTGASDAGKLILADAGGRLSPTLWNVPTTVSASTTLTPYQYNIRASASSSSIVITLPTSPNIGVRHRILREDATSFTLTILCGGSNTIIDGHESGTLFRLNKQYSWIEFEWNGTNWVILQTYLVPDDLTTNYNTSDTSLGTTRDTWVYGGMGLALRAYSKYRLSMNGVITCTTSTTDPVSIHVAFSEASDGSAIVEERFIGRIGSDSAITSIVFNWTAAAFYTVGSVNKDIYMVARANTVSGTPTLSNFALDVNGTNDDGANILGERVG